MVLSSTPSRDGIDVDRFFRSLEAQNVPFCVVGEAERVPEEIDSDLDVVIDLSSLETLRLVQHFCSSAHLRIVQHLQHEIGAHYCVLWNPESADISLLSLDTCRDYLRQARLFLPAHELMEGRMRAPSGQHQHPKSFYVPRSDMAFVYYFLKKIDKLDFTDAHGRYLSCVWRAAPTATRTRLARYFNAAQVARIERAAQSGNWREIRSNLPEFRRKLRSSTRRLSPNVLLGEIARIGARIFRPTGFHVVFLGPDGSGKSTVINLVLDDLRHAFRHIAHYHLFPAPGQPGSQPIADPHGQRARGVVLSVLKIGLWWCRYTAGWVKRVWPGRLRSTAIVFDRYYHDLLIDPKRYRYGGPLWLARAVGWFVPKPDLWIILDAPTDVLRARKNGISDEEISRQRQAYRDFAASFPNAVVVDASELLDRVVRSSTRALLAAMAERAEARLSGALRNVVSEVKDLRANG